jgi:senataxin
MEEKLLLYDFERIDNGLNWAKLLIDQEESAGRAFDISLLGERHGLVLLTLYEALCCMPYMRTPDKRQLFQYVFVRLSEKKPLRLPKNTLLPAMTHFLFEDNPHHLRFAKLAWQRIDENGMTELQFNWAVSENLIGAIQSLLHCGPDNRDSYPTIQRFWEGLRLILRTMDDTIIIHCLRGMEIKPTIYDLLFLHMQCHSEGILVNVLHVLSVLLQKSPKAFWDAIGDARPFVVAEQVFSAPQFKSILAQSLALTSQAQDGTFLKPFTTSWVDAWIQSLKREQQTDACESLLHMLFGTLVVDRTIGEEGQAACFRAGLDALSFTLNSFVGAGNDINTGTTLLYINAILNHTHRYKDLIRDCAETKVLTQVTFGVPEAAIAVIRAALELDALAFRQESKAYNLGHPVQQAVIRSSAALWETFLDILWDGKQELANNMLLAIAPLINVEQIRPNRKPPNPLNDSQKRFNVELSKTADAVSRVIQRLCDFRQDSLQALFFTSRVTQPMIGFIVHGEDIIREAGVELIKTVAGQSSRDEAIEALLASHLHNILLSFTSTINSIMTEPFPWGPAPHIVSASVGLLNGLAGQSGVLRSKPLSGTEQKAVMAWWASEWHCIKTCFEQTESWSLKVPIKRMEDFCREVIDLAGALLEHDSVIASALQQQTPSTSTNLESKAPNTGGMGYLLQPCRKYGLSLIRMLRLRDKYLVDATVALLCKMLRRLREADLEIPERDRAALHNICKRNPNTGSYPTPTNLFDTQRAALLEALGDGGPEPEVEVVEVKIGSKTTKSKTQTSIEQWSKSGTTTPPLGVKRTNRDDVKELTSSIDKRRSLLDAISSRQSQPTKPKPKPMLDQRILVANQASIKESRQKAKLEKERRDAAAIAQAKALRGPTVAGEGSGLLGLGVTGKDHAPKKSEIMVNSDDEEDQDSDEEDQLDALINSTKEGRKNLTDAERRHNRAMVQKNRGPVKKVKVQRSAKDMRARLIPPMEKLHQAILEWNIFHEGNDPPNAVTCSHVSDTYQHPKEYKETFMSLLISEAWRSFVTAKDEATSKPFGIKIVTRMNVDSFIEVTASLPIAESRDRGLSEGDIAILSKSERPLTDASQPNCLTRIWKTTYKKDFLEVTYRISNHKNSLASHLMPGSELRAIKITNMTTIEREYAALESLQYYDLMPEILNAEPSPILNYVEERIEKVMSIYNLNPGQAKAILGARDNDGFTLIQG